ncbi:hypothetical protein TBLA_0G02890 [Henningerozyma blattae CBS 6284]|uniref:Phosphatidate cytidylyltransferase n=1 Tax=Henningerozyma blattae (strain ATCC 34711 / CBS 6284 / DSM 70876 / NBRC 10599 / NRRL Y-10934 / UCD 77-7) TaxID=1071380 RepID=I2H774_HENB6|nr:hypothetical protein TBLA_0G02890 [Tetrapisispora blattae CBS 6284]CCH62226.1 hypothetical protein TBLA_0G02890 [Tetrapisispora blattae CBS 6284]
MKASTSELDFVQHGYYYLKNTYQYNKLNKMAGKKSKSKGSNKKANSEKAINRSKESSPNIPEKKNESSTSAATSAPTSGEPVKETRNHNFVVRTITSLFLISGFFAVLASGYIWCITLIFLCQIATFKECINVTGETARFKKLPMTKLANWHLLFTTIYYLNGISLFAFFQDFFFKYKILTLVITYHRFVCYFSYLFGFMLFVYSLRRGSLKYQFGSLCITHMVLLLVVFQAHLGINNVINGLFWFLMPCGLVIINDIFAYLCGITFGRTKLIEISPKKTLEGFIGAWFFTALFSIVLTKLLVPFNYLICPVTDVTTNFFSPLQCELNPVFIPQDFRLPPIIFEKIGISVITMKPIYFHALNLATFASLFAPFGGFFASGLKRTFKVKDFGHTIPGHGGITDRIDCQFLMGSFTNLYYETFINEHRITVQTILSTILMNFDERQIVDLICMLTQALFSRGVIPDKGYQALNEVYANVSESLTTSF